MGLFMTDIDIILASTLGKFEKQAGCIVPDDSDTAIRFKIFASEIARITDRIDFCTRQMFPNTAEGEYLERHGAVRGIFKKSASKSFGKVLFTSKTPVTTPILIPKGTLCTSSKTSTLMFETVADVTLIKNATTIFADVESTVVGSHTNIAAGYIDVLVTSISGITSIANKEKTKGGADDEPDDMFRERVIEAYNKVSNGANLNYYEQFARTKPDVWHAKAAFTPNTSNEVELFVENRTHTLNDGVVADLQAEIAEKRTLGTKVTVKRPEEKIIDIDLIVKVDNLANNVLYNDTVFTVLNDEFALLKIGQRFSPGKLAKAILQLEGIMDVSITKPTLPVPVAYNQIAEHGSVNIYIQQEVSI